MHGKSDYGPDGKTTTTGATCDEDSSDMDPAHAHVTVTTVTTTVDGDGNVTGTTSKTSGTTTYQTYFQSLGDAEAKAIKSATGVNMSVTSGGRDWSQFPFLAGFGIGPANTPNGQSTGRAQPQNLNEQLAMKQAQSNPGAGEVVPVGGGMKDSRWPGSDEWVKMRQNVNETEVHYNYNTKTGATADWKFK